MSVAISTLNSIDKEKQLNEILDQVLERHMQPEDRYEVAAILESLGWNDRRVHETFGAADVFALADDLWERMKRKVLFTPFAKAENMKPRVMLMALLRNFLRGVIFAVPMAVSVFSMLTLKFSLWSYEYLSVELATSIAIGTILSFVTVGGFTQAIARRGFFYIIQGYYNMARRVTFHFIGLGFAVCIGLSATILLLNMIIRMFPFSMLAMIILYFFFLNSIWLSVTVMYILRKELVFTGLIIAGIALVYLLFIVLGIDNIILDQLIALSLVSAASILLVIYYFKQAEKKSEKGISPQMPKMSVTLYSTMPYFVYGFMYFSFLYVDRVMSWSTNSQYMPYLIWFRGDYELGLDFALLVLILPMGISEVVLTRLMAGIELSQKAYWGDEGERMGRAFRRTYYRMLGFIAAVALSSAVALYLLLYFIFDHFSVGLGSTLYAHPVTHLVYVIALISYVFLSVGLMNAVILFSLSQPQLVIRAIWPALVINIIVGFVASRWMTAFETSTKASMATGHGYAVLGLLMGSIVFMAISIQSTRKVLNNLDYYLYAAS